MATRYLVRRIDYPLQAAAELARLRDVAQRLVRSAWGAAAYLFARRRLAAACIERRRDS